MNPQRYRVQPAADRFDLVDLFCLDCGMVVGDVRTMTFVLQAMEGHDEIKHRLASVTGNPDGYTADGRAYWF